MFQLIFYNIHNGKKTKKKEKRKTKNKKKPPLHIMNSSAIYDKSNSRGCLISFNCRGLCTSYKEAKFHRNNLAKLAISRSNDTGIPLPTHLWKSQFITAVIDNFDHSDFNLLPGTVGTHSRYSNDTVSNQT